MLNRKSRMKENNDFWNDCLKESNSYKSNMSNSSINGKKRYIQYKNMKINNNNSIYRKKKNKKFDKLSNTYTSIDNRKIIKEALILEERNRQENNKKILESIEHMVSLYDKGMALKETQKRNIIQNDEKNLKKEKEKCSFKPIKYRNKSLQNKINKDYGNSTIYERGVKYQQRNMAKRAKLFEEYNKKYNIVYPFHPDVTFKNLNHVFYSDNFCKEQADNDSNKIFLFRLMKAREEEEYKKNCLENNVNKKFEINWSCPKKLKRSVSQKDSLLFRKNLHDTLLNLKCLPTNNDIDNHSVNNENI